MNQTIDRSTINNRPWDHRNVTLLLIFSTIVHQPDACLPIPTIQALLVIVCVVLTVCSINSHWLLSNSVKAAKDLRLRSAGDASARSMFNFHDLLIHVLGLGFVFKSYSLSRNSTIHFLTFHNENLSKNMCLTRMQIHKYLPTFI